MALIDSRNATMQQCNNTLAQKKSKKMFEKHLVVSDIFSTFVSSFEGKTSRVDERQARSQSAHSAERLGTLCGKARQAQPSGSAEGEKRLEARMVGTEVTT